MATESLDKATAFFLKTLQSPRQQTASQSLENSSNNNSHSNVNHRHSTLSYEQIRAKNWVTCKFTDIKS